MHKGFSNILFSILNHCGILNVTRLFVLWSVRTLVRSLQRSGQSHSNSYKWKLIEWKIHKKTRQNVCIEKWEKNKIEQPVIFFLENFQKIINLQRCKDTWWLKQKDQQSRSRCQWRNVNKSASSKVKLIKDYFKMM